MNDRKYRFRWPGTLLLALAVGCSSKTADRPTAADEGAVREKFAELQSAMKNRDADKLWRLLDTKSQADAERVAKDIQETHTKSSAEEKAKQEEALGLSGPDVVKLTGIGFLKTKRFQKKYDELPESKIEKVVVQGDNATVHFLEPDGDHEKLIVVRSDGQWKVWLAMPKASLPSKSANIPGTEEIAAREKFAELQSAVKSHDADKLWKLLDGKSRADAESEAKSVQNAYAKATAEDKAKLEESLGLGGNDITRLTGVGVLKSKRIQGKYHELPDSKIEKVAVEGDKATIHYIEPDDDKRTLSLIRQDGQWKASLTIPKLSQP